MCIQHTSSVPAVCIRLSACPTQGKMLILYFSRQNHTLGLYALRRWCWYCRRFAACAFRHRHSVGFSEETPNWRFLEAFYSVRAKIQSELYAGKLRSCAGKTHAKFLRGKMIILRTWKICAVPSKKADVLLNASMRMCMHGGVS